jgi:hypothetical protein
MIVECAYIDVYARQTARTSCRARSILHRAKRHARQAARCLECAITERVVRVSRDTLKIEAGSLYPALHRMEEAGCGACHLGRVEQQPPRARFYTLTATVAAEACGETEHWARLAGAVGPC